LQVLDASARWLDVRFGIRLHRLWRLKAGVAACAVLATLLAVWSTASISLSPPGLHSRIERVSTASVSAVIDTQKSSMADLREDTHDIGKLTNRAVVIGTVMTSPAVRSAIARRAGVRADELQIIAPMSAPVPAPPNGTPTITVLANATVPLLHIYTQASDTRTAERLADAAASQTQAYLTQVAITENTPERAQLRLVALGSARGAETTKSVRHRTPIIVFLIVFAAGCATLIFVSRIRDELRFAPAAEPV
jgi:hypothetical protein